MIIQSMRCIVAGVCMMSALVMSIPAKGWAASGPYAAMELPVPGQMMSLSSSTDPVRLEGVRVYSQEPFRFDFIVNRGQAGEDVRQESERLIRYFLAALTVPEEDLWVNLSPFEENRIIPEKFGQTELGRDLLSEDYVLKQVASSLVYPDGAVGRVFWKKVYALAAEKFGIDRTDIPLDALTKVWIVPSQALIYEDPGTSTAYILESRMKVMLESDHQAQKGGTENSSYMSSVELANKDPLQGISEQVIRSVIIPLLEQEVNEGAHFSRLRQAYQSLILAAWYKRKVKASLLASVYVDQRRVKGIETGEPLASARIYEQYRQAFRQGVFNIIREERIGEEEDFIARKYFSGGLEMGVDTVIQITGFQDPAMAAVFRERYALPGGDQRVIVSAVLDPEFEGQRELINSSQPVAAIDNAMKTVPDLFNMLYKEVSFRPLSLADAEALPIEDSLSFVDHPIFNPSGVSVVALYGRSVLRKTDAILQGVAIVRQSDFRYSVGRNDVQAFLQVFRFEKTDIFKEALLARVLNELRMGRSNLQAWKYLLAVAPDNKEALEFFFKAGFVLLAKKFDSGSEDPDYYVITVQRAEVFVKRVMKSRWYPDDAQTANTGGIDMRDEQMVLQVQGVPSSAEVSTAKFIDPSAYMNVPGFSVRIIDLKDSKFCPLTGCH